MKKIFIFMLIVNSLLLASNQVDNQKAKKKLLEKHLKMEMEKEKKYSKEQTFYNEKNYDFKGAEVDPDTVKSIHGIEVDDFDMDSVYD